MNVILQDKTIQKTQQTNFLVRLITLARQMPCNREKCSPGKQLPGYFLIDLNVRLSLLPKVWF